MVTVRGLHPLDRKLWRDLVRIRSQAAATAAIIAIAVTALVMSTTLLLSLEETRTAFYERGRMADVFATAVRVPERIAGEIARIDGVRQIQSRIVERATLDMPGLAAPASGHLVSIPETGQPTLNRIVLREGGWITPGRADDVIVSAAFADAHGLVPGDPVFATLDGVRRTLRVTGIGRSPEFVYTVSGSGFLPDDQRFGVLWMGREAMEAAFDLDGAFNDIVVSLSPGTDSNRVIEAIDRLLDPYGSVGAIDRSDQSSHAFLQSEIDGLVATATVLPTVLIAIAAFVLNVILTRIVDTEREQIGLLKAFGYGNLAIASHYWKLVMVISLAGTLVGFAGGIWAGYGVTRLYIRFFEFPALVLTLDPSVFLVAAATAAATASLGALMAVRRCLALSPAEAMRPPAPGVYGRSVIDRLGLIRRVGQLGRVMIRQLTIKPARSLLTALGIALGGSLYIGTTFTGGAANWMLDIQFSFSERQDVTLQFVDERAYGAIDLARALPGVLTVEPFRIVPVELSYGHRTERTVLQGLLADAHLVHPLDRQQRPIDIPPAGLALSAHLADTLGVGPGDLLTIRVLEGRQATLTLPATAVVDDYVGSMATLRLETLNRAMGDGPVITGVYALVDADRLDALFAAVKDTPQISDVVELDRTVEATQEMLDRTISVYRVLFSLFSGTIVFGILYNAARVTLSEQGRELASLRVLGFTKGEVAIILLGQLAILTVIALPGAALFGNLLAYVIVTYAMDPELFRLPFVITRGTYGEAALVMVGSAVLAGWLVRRRIGTLSLIDVLKTRE